MAHWTTRSTVKMSPVVVDVALERQGYRVGGGRGRVGDGEGGARRRQPLVGVAEDGEGRSEVEEVPLGARVAPRDWVDAVDPPGLLGGGRGRQVHDEAGHRG